MIRLRLASRVLVSLGAAVVLVGSLVPWVRSGSVDRSSYDLLDIVDRLGFGDRGPVSLLVDWWAVVPLLSVSGVVAAWWGRWTAAGALAVVAGASALVVSLGVALADPAVVTVESGPRLTAVGAAALLAGGVTAFVVALDRRGSGSSGAA